MYPVFANKISTVTIDADNSDIRKAIVNAVPLAKKQMELLAKKFQGATDKQTCENIYNYLMTLTYVEDKEQQIIKLPSAIIQKNIVSDCKSFALLTSGILENLQIPYEFTLTSYNDNPIPQHIYVTTKAGIIIDAVWGGSGGSFNTEKKYKFKYTIPMNVKYMTGTGCPGMGCSENSKCNCSNGIGNIFKKFGNWAKEKVDDAGDIARKAVDDAGDIARKAIKDSKTVTLGPGRLLFKAMVAGNLDGIANSLANMDQAKLRTYWNKVGGNITSLNTDISNGKKRKPVDIGFLGALKKSIGIGNVYFGTTQEDEKKINDAILVISPSLGALIGSVVPGLGTAVGAGGGLSLGAVLTQITPIVLGLVKQSKSNKTKLDTKAPETKIPLPDESKKSSKAGFDFNRDIWNGSPLFGIKGKYIILGSLIAGGVIYAKKEKMF